jgi:teichoic acid transport system ATP-binding protein
MKFGEIAEFADIGDFVNEPVKTYSSGMLMRLAFSVVAHVEPDILIVDEALAVGDFVFQQKCYRRIAELKSRGCSILFVSHDMTAVAQFCDYVHVLSGGKLDFSGKSADAINHYKRISTTAERSTYQTASTQLLSSEQEESITKNDNVREYGSGKARIKSWELFGSSGKKTATVISADEVVTIEMNIVFEESCDDAICGYFISDAQGREIVGTNTWYSGRPLGPQARGNELRVSFSQAFGLAGGDYMLNLGVSEFSGGRLVAHHRLYDLCVVKVIATNHIVGFFLPPTHIEIVALAKHE